MLLTHFRNGKMKECKWRMLLVPNLFRNFYIRAFITFLNLHLVVIELVFFYIIASKKFQVSKLDVCIAEGPTAIAAFFIQKMGLVEKTVYSARDWYPCGVQGILFSFLDRFCVTKTDQTWNVTYKIQNARRWRWKGSKFLDKAKKVVRLPLANVSVNIFKFKPSRQIRIAYIGSIREDVALELVIRAISKLRSEGVTVFLDIAGQPTSSRVVKEIKCLTKSLGVRGQVNFYGYLDENALSQLLRRCSWGLALFLGGDKNYSNYARPLKVVTYIENGLPIIINEDNALANEVIAAGAGVTVEPSLDAIMETLRKFVTDYDFTAKLMEGVRNYASEISSPNELWDAIKNLLLQPR
jgi:glycosyltransferase involved in cell wall biosynthesis